MDDQQAQRKKSRGKHFARHHDLVEFKNSMKPIIQTVLRAKPDFILEKLWSHDLANRDEEARFEEF